MIAKLGKGAGFGGCAKYDLDQGKKNGKDARLLDSKGVPLKVDKNGNLTANANDISRAFRAQAQALNPGVKKPVGRIMLSFDPKDTPKLTDAYMLRIAQEYMERMGITNTQYTIVRHSEKPHQHVHIIYNRVDNDGKIISDSNNFARLGNKALSKHIFPTSEQTPENIQPPLDFCVPVPFQPHRATTILWRLRFAQQRRARTFQTGILLLQFTDTRTQANVFGQKFFVSHLDKELIRSITFSGLFNSLTSL